MPRAVMIVINVIVLSNKNNTRCRLTSSCRCNSANSFNVSDS